MCPIGKRINIFVVEFRAHQDFEGLTDGSWIFEQQMHSSDYEEINNRNGDKSEMHHATWEWVGSEVL